MKLTRQQLRKQIIESLSEGMESEPFRPIEWQGINGDANALLQIFLRGELDERELEYLREDNSIDEIISLFEQLIAILKPLTR
ncbi:MAG TPA: hypothetical protein EYQ00_10980 [Dehalococcoidia bacterium]|jgi:hypothetical protein|nr:hypothetical protein [Dehalococcoidia bacterium]